MFCNRMVRGKTKVCNSERKKTETCSWREKKDMHTYDRSTKYHGSYREYSDPW